MSWLRRKCCQFQSHWCDINGIMHCVCSKSNHAATPASILSAEILAYLCCKIRKPHWFGVMYLETVRYTKFQPYGICGSWLKMSWKKLLQTNRPTPFMQNNYINLFLKIRTRYCIVNYCSIILFLALRALKERFTATRFIPVGPKLQPIMK